MLEEQLRDHGVVPIGEHIRFDQHLVADGALDRVAPAVDLRPDRLDDGAGRRGADLVARLIQA
jgi:hypothetical protein